MSLITALLLLHGLAAVFLIGYGTLRFIGEFARQPDAFLGFVAFDWLTMGQLLCLPMLLAGAVLLVLSRRHRAA